MSPHGSPKGESRSAQHEGTPIQTFVKAVEYWVPGPDRRQLEYGGGLYGQATRFAMLSRKLCFGRGEGLPGKVWEQGCPQLLKQFEGSYFQRTAAAHAEGLTGALAWPIFAGEYLNAVLVVFFGDGDDHAGAIELWRNDPAESKDMVLADGHYGRTAEAFEFLSRRTTFRRGTGLPGGVWDSGLPAFIPDLGKGSRFLRSDSAQQVGINRGFALACAGNDGRHHVVALLSALNTPIVRRFEVWQREGDGLARMSGFCESEGELGPDPSWVERGQGTLGSALLSGVPAVSDDVASEPGGPGAKLQRVAVRTLVAIPVLRDGRCIAVMAWYF
jgi:hypothetical protein